MTLYYCDRWFTAGKRPIEALDEETARARHTAREPYTLVVGDIDQPTHVISFRFGSYESLCRAERSPSVRLLAGRA